MKLFDSELKVMEVLWEHGPLPAGEVARILAEQTGWNRNTTYTVIKKCIAKGAIARKDPKFICEPLFTRKEAQSYETEELIDRMFGGSKKQFFAAFLANEELTDQDLRELRDLIGPKEEE